MEYIHHAAKDNDGDNTGNIYERINDRHDDHRDLKHVEEEGDDVDNYIEEKHLTIIKKVMVAIAIRAHVWPQNTI